MTVNKGPEIEAEVPGPLGDGFDFPQDVDDLLLAFPATVMHLMPTMEAIPDEFKRGRNEWSDFVSDWFFRGWPEDRILYTRPDVDPEKAHRHLRAILGSYEPKHQHKEAAISWLMSRWYGAVRPVIAPVEK